MARLSIEAFTRFFEFYQGETHQMDAVAELWRKLPPDLLQEDADWVVKYRVGQSLSRLVLLIKLG